MGFSFISVHKESKKSQLGKTTLKFWIQKYRVGCLTLTLPKSALLSLINHIEKKNKTQPKMLRFANQSCEEAVGYAVIVF